MTKENYYIPAKYVVHLHIKDEVKEKFRTIRKQEWIKLLNDTTQDWAVNLLLYDIYGRDAILYFANHPSADIWRILYKNKDIKYWKRKLKND